MERPKYIVFFIMAVSFAMIETMYVDDCNRLTGCSCSKGIYGHVNNIEQGAFKNVVGHGPYLGGGNLHIGAYTRNVLSGAFQQIHSLFSITIENNVEHFSASSFENIYDIHQIKLSDISNIGFDFWANFRWYA